MKLQTGLQVNNNIILPVSSKKLFAEQRSLIKIHGKEAIIIPSSKLLKNITKLTQKYLDKGYKIICGTVPVNEKENYYRIILIKSKVIEVEIKRS